MRVAVAAATASAASAVLGVSRLRSRPRQPLRCGGAFKSVSYLCCSSTKGRPSSASAVGIVALREQEDGVTGEDGRQESLQPPAGRSWHLSSGACTCNILSLIAASNAMQFPSKALAQLCDATTAHVAFIAEGSNTTSNNLQRLVLMDLDPTTAKLAISFIGPLLSAYGFLFIVRIVMSWYPKLPVGKFPYVVAYAPTEPLLILTRKVIPPLGGVDVTPVVWFGLISFLNEILVGPQGLLVLLSQQV